MEYEIDELVKLAKRENNKKREYLYVNPLQAKHIPSDPSETLDMCRALAEKINGRYPGERLFVIGFAETATGIAAATAHFLNEVSFYQQTTREKNEGEKYLFFTESHSHATEQLLSERGLQEALKGSGRIVFIDDEVTTGNTILKLIEAIGSARPVTIASVLNSMEEAREQELAEKGIECICLRHIPFEYRKNDIKSICYNPLHDHDMTTDKVYDIQTESFNNAFNARNALDFRSFDESAMSLAEKICREFTGKECRSLLILGTEEFMYQGILTGAAIEKTGVSVKVHATTRSPVIASDTAGYPLHNRYKLRSVYDENRRTYVYNISGYDKVFIFTDAPVLSRGINDLYRTLEENGNEDITLIRFNY